ncbi:MAG: EamA family transporter [Acidimicrobiales bacterium]
MPTDNQSGPVAGLLHRAPPEALFLLSAAAQYSGAVIAIDLFDDTSPSAVAVVRVAAAALIRLAVPRRGSHPRWHARDVWWAALFGISTALMNLFFYLGIERLPLGKGVTIEFIGPVAVAAARTRTGRNLVALLLATVGVVVLGGVELGDEPLGLMWILLASAAWAGYVVLGSRVAMADRGVAGLGVGLVFGTIVIAPFGAADVVDAVATPHIIALAALVGLLSSAIGYGIDQSTLRRIPVRRFSVMLALLPVTAVVFGVLFLDQNPTTIDLVGIALVLAGVATQEREVTERQQRGADAT